MAGGLMPADRLSLLLVDDHQDGADSLYEVLRAYGYDPQVVYSASAALAEATSKLPDVVISDIGMPHLNGCEVAKRILALGGVRPLMIAITGFNHMRDSCMQAGFDHFFLKPADPTELLALIQEHAHKLGRSR